jgi:hypothetical protein
VRLLRLALLSIHDDDIEWGVSFVTGCPVVSAIDILLLCTVRPRIVRTCAGLKDAR